MQNASLFGLYNSNRDFRLKKSWGKNQFNSSFPTSLCCYMHAHNIPATYLAIRNGKLTHLDITVSDVFGISPTSNDIFFAFESIYAPFQKYIKGNLPRTDLVIQNKKTGQCIAGLEIKLTALPDNTTCKLGSFQYGSEIVVRPDTIVYLACSVAASLDGKLDQLLTCEININDWSEAYNILPHVPSILSCLNKVCLELESKQTPFLIQPIWKTIGKSAQLAEDCLDIFVWSDASFIHFISDNIDTRKITRQTRTAIWLYKMLSDFNKEGQFNHDQIIDELSYNTKNDKAFSLAGNITNKYMACSRLEKPRIKKTVLKNIILNGGQNLLSPERRFDAIIVNSLELFD